MNRDEINLESIKILEKMGGITLIRRMIDSFNTSVPIKIQEVYLSIQHSDLVNIERVTHSIKSSAGILGAIRLQRLSEEMELKAESNKPEDYQILVQELEDSYNKVKTNLEIILESYDT